MLLRSNGYYAVFLLLFIDFRQFHGYYVHVVPPALEQARCCFAVTSAVISEFVRPVLCSSSLLVFVLTLDFYTSVVFPFKINIMCSY